MARQFDQHKIRETQAALRELAAKKSTKMKDARLMNTAASLIEDMSVVVYGIQERFPIVETFVPEGQRVPPLRPEVDVETGDKL